MAKRARLLLGIFLASPAWGQSLPSPEPTELPEEAAPATNPVPIADPRAEPLLPTLDVNLLLSTGWEAGFQARLRALKRLRAAKRTGDRPALVNRLEKARAQLERLRTLSAENEGTPAAKTLRRIFEPSPGFPTAGSDLSADSRAPPLPPAAVFLNSLDRIRVVFTGAPGLGHQTATLSIVRRLREIGFKGDLEAIYERDENLPVQLGQLMPEFDPHEEGDQFIPSLGMNVRGMASFHRNSAPVPLALTGGADLPRSFAKDFLADVFLRLGPMGWDVEHYQDEIHVQGQDEPIVIEYPKRPAFIYQPSPSQVNEDYFSRLNPANIAPPKIEGLKTMFRELGNHDILSAYGLASFNKHSLHILLLAVSHAMSRRPRLFRRQGVVVPILIDVEGKVQELLATINSLDCLECLQSKARRPVVRAANEKLKNRLQVASVTDPDLKGVLRGLPKNGLLLVKTGFVPPTLFEWFFSMSTLPPTLMGKNANNLARLLGIPFLPLDMDFLEYVFESAPLSAAEREKALALCTFRRRKYSNRTLNVPEALRYIDGDYEFERIGEYIAAAMTPGSSFRNMFREAKISPRAYDRDKLLLAIQAALGRFAVGPGDEAVLRPIPPWVH